MSIKQNGPRRGRSTVVLIGACAVLATMTSPALADENAGSLATASDDVLTVLENVTPAVLEDTTSQSPSLTGENALVVASSLGGTTTVPADPSDPITLNSANLGTVSLDLPFADEASDASLVADGVVAFDNGNGSTTIPVVKDDGSVQIVTVISTTSAPTRYDYPLTLPSGATLESNGDNASIVVSGADGAFLGGFAPAWARDAHGEPVATHYEISGHTLTQVVSPTADTAYPVVADPAFGQDLILSVKKVNSAQGLTYAVRPTTFGRLASDLVLISKGWAEAVARGVPQRQGLFEQFACHPQSVVARAKSSWNLDTWRPTVGIVRTIAAGCNP